jgi:hypothetical protein
MPVWIRIFQNTFWKSKLRRICATASGMKTENSMPLETIRKIFILKQPEAVKYAFEKHETNGGADST